ncbi:lytic murein transglycosylase B [Hydrogenophaga sp. R2]|uniref:lytic murein transglycosylase B n=1 Tax=Hydrogenophaga sp. R2 TaxID=3132827 RepID=UPI003CF05AC4
MTPILRPLSRPRHTRLPALRCAPLLSVLLTAAVCLGGLSAHAAQPRKAEPRPASAPFSYSQSPAAMAFADDLASRRDLDPAWVRQQIGAAQRVPAIIRAITPPPTTQPKNWAAYRARFIEPIRLNAGQRFWEENAATLARAEARFGVPASLIVGVLGVESLYGRHMGNFRVMDALVTLSFDFPAAHPRAAARTEFFRSELEQFLSLMNRSGRDPMGLRGSYAGAMGWPQFMPSSWAKYAIDFDEDGQIDLFDNPADVIGSVANYFKVFGWQTDMPTRYPVRVEAGKTDLDTLLAPDILPTFSAARMQALGAGLEGAAAEHGGPLALVELQNAGAPSTYVAGTENFYVVTRYNWSSYYALAVIELGEAIQARVNAARSAAR